MPAEDRDKMIANETKMIRRLRILAELTTALIAQDQSLTLEQGWEHVEARKAAAAGGGAPREMLEDVEEEDERTIFVQRDENGHSNGHDANDEEREN